MSTFPLQEKDKNGGGKGEGITGLGSLAYNVLEGLIDPICIIEPQDYKILWANGKFMEIYRHCNGSIIGSTCRNVIYGPDNNSNHCDHYCPIRISRITEKPAGVEHTHGDGRGKIRFVEVNVAPVFNENGNIAFFICTHRDLTRCKIYEQSLQEAEEQIQQAQKMEVMGRLAGGIAHDFNNLITAINGNNELMRLQLEHHSPHREYSDEIKKAVSKARNLVQQLLSFSRKQVVKTQFVDINKVIRDMGKILHRVMGGSVELVMELSPGLAAVKADPGQIGQVIMNLAVNARDAMGEKGRLAIHTENVEVNGSYASKNRTLDPGYYVALTVSDNGCGMDGKVLERIFEPFFTTKEEGKGTGLGLSTVYSIISRNGGQIKVFSRPKKGTRFEIYFPAVTNENGMEEPKTLPERRAGGTETVLVVEDDCLLRNMVVRTLQVNGYRVLEARDGMEAFQICRDFNEPVHLLISDILMPKVKGPELADMVESIHPGLKVLYLTGYPEKVLPGDENCRNKRTHLLKPVTSGVLLGKVRELLDDGKTQPVDGKTCNC